MIGPSLASRAATSVPTAVRSGRPLRANCQDLGATDLLGLFLSGGIRVLRSGPLVFVAEDHASWI